MAIALAIALTALHKTNKASLRVISFLHQLETEQFKAVDNIVDLINRLTLVSASAKNDNYHMLVKTLQHHFSLKYADKESLIHSLPTLTDIYCSGLISYLISRYPELSPSEIEVCSMIALGIQAHCIMSAFGYDNPTSFYNRRSSIRKKMHLPQSMVLETYIDSVVEGLSKNRTEALDKAFSTHSIAPLADFFDSLK